MPISLSPARARIDRRDLAAVDQHIPIDHHQLNVPRMSVIGEVLIEHRLQAECLIVEHDQVRALVRLEFPIGRPPKPRQCRSLISQRAIAFERLHRSRRHGSAYCVLRQAEHEGLFFVPPKFDLILSLPKDAWWTCQSHEQAKCDCPGSAMQSIDMFRMCSYSITFRRITAAACRARLPMSAVDI